MYVYVCNNNFQVLLINVYVPYENLRDDATTDEPMLQLSLLY
jgi:hypothetical protein